MRLLSHSRWRMFKGTVYWFWSFSVCCFQRGQVRGNTSDGMVRGGKIKLTVFILGFPRAQWDLWRPGALKKKARYLVYDRKYIGRLIISERQQLQPICLFEAQVCHHIIVMCKPILNLLSKKSLAKMRKHPRACRRTGRQVFNSYSSPFRNYA